MPAPCLQRSLVYIGGLRVWCAQHVCNKNGVAAASVVFNRIWLCSDCIAADCAPRNSLGPAFTCMPQGRRVGAARGAGVQRASAVPVPLHGLPARGPAAEVLPGGCWAAPGGGRGGGGRTAGLLLLLQCSTTGCISQIQCGSMLSGADQANRNIPCSHRLVKLRVCVCVCRMGRMPP